MSKELKWYENFLEKIAFGAAGGFVVAFTQQLATTGSVPPFLTIIGTAYIGSMLVWSYKLYK